VIVGVVEATEEGVPVPTELTAATWKSYKVSLTNDATVAVVVLDTPSMNVSHELDDDALYCTT
jgi:hypothetical protein